MRAWGARTGLDTREGLQIPCARQSPCGCRRTMIEIGSCLVMASPPGLEFAFPYPKYRPWYWRRPASGMRVPGSGWAHSWAHTPAARRNHTQESGENCETGLALGKGLGSRNVRARFPHAPDSLGGSGGPATALVLILPSLPLPIQNGGAPLGFGLHLNRGYVAFGWGDQKARNHVQEHSWSRPLSTFRFCCTHARSCSGNPRNPGNPGSRTAWP